MLGTNAEIKPSHRYSGSKFYFAENVQWLPFVLVSQFVHVGNIMALRQIGKFFQLEQIEKAVRC
jgi:hypothetical protein